MYELRLAIRSLTKRPALTFLTVATLAVGVGSTTATFTYLGSFFWDNVVLEPDTLLWVQYRHPQGGGLALPISYPDFLDFRREAADVGEVVASWIWGQGIQKSDGNAAFVWGHAVSDGYLQTLGARPVVGRLLLAEDHEPGAARAAVLGDRFWRRHYDRSPDAIGDTLRIGGQEYTIVGVTPRSFIGTGIPADLYTPIRYTGDGAPEWTPDQRDSAHTWGGRVWAMIRLADPVTHEQAQGVLQAIAADLDRAYPSETRRRELDFDTAMDGNTRDLVAGAVRLLAAAGLLLLLANANVGSLLVARYLDRRGDISILAALGATARRISAQFLIEGVMLAVLAGGAGLLLASVLLSAVRRILIAANPIDMGQWGEGAEHTYLMLDGRVVMFAFGTSLVTTLVLGLLPSLHAFRRDLVAGLVTRGTASSSGVRTRSLLVVVQVSLAVVLLVGAGLLVQSLDNVWRVDPGFDDDRLAIATLALAPDSGGEPDLREAFREAREHAAAIPGVERSTLAEWVPLWGWRSSEIAFPDREEKLDVVNQVVGAGYFEALDQLILRGRPIDDRDRVSDPLVAVVNQELASRFWPDSDPVGQTLHLEILRLEIDDTVRIVGVAADTRQDLRSDPRPQLYFSAAQINRFRMSLLLRTSGPADAFLTSIRDVLDRAHPRLAVVNVATFETHLEGRLYQERLYATLSAVMAGLGLTLAATGIFSVLTFIARARRKEHAVRAALGARPRDIVARTTVEIGVPVGLGIVLGLGGAAAAGRGLRALLFGIDPIDPSLLAVAPLLLLLVAALAGLGPTLKAGRVDPMTVLRDE